MASLVKAITLHLNARPQMRRAGASRMEDVLVLDEEPRAQPPSPPPPPPQNPPPEHQDAFSALETVDAGVTAPRSASANALGLLDPELMVLGMVGERGAKDTSAVSPERTAASAMLGLSATSVAARPRQPMRSVLSPAAQPTPNPPAQPGPFRPGDWIMDDCCPL